MDISNMKNMVILKNLPSNIVDEAIVILKSNQKIKRPEFIENKINNSKFSSKVQENTDNYIVNEAEMLITNYITNLEKPKEILKGANKELERKYMKMKKLSIILGIITFVQIVLNFIR